MKALVIADDDVVLNRLTSLLGAQGYDCIVYRWLLKALDNVEEIKPHLVVISAQDYPRHWKTFVQYISALANTNTPKVILYIDSDFSQDEKAKAQILGISGVLPANCTDDEFAGVIQSLQKHISPKKNESMADKTSAQIEKTYFIYTSPVNNAYVTGTVSSFDGALLSFIPDSGYDKGKLIKGMNIAPCTLENGGHIYPVTAVVKEISSSADMNAVVFEIHKSAKDI